LDVTLFASLNNLDNARHWEYLKFGLILGQAALIAAMVVWVRVNVVVRVLVAGLCLAGLAGLVIAAESAPKATVFGSLLFYFAFYMACFLLPRIAGVSCQLEPTPGPTKPAETQDRKPERLQFSVWQMLSVMTAVAIAVAAVQFGSFRVAQVSKNWELGGLLAFTAAGSWFAVLLPRCDNPRRIAAGVALWLLVGLACVTLYRWSRATPSGFWIVITSSACVVVSSALVLRVAGYRLVFRNRS
jgi:hypothetical protein